MYSKDRYEKCCVSEVGVILQNQHLVKSMKSFVQLCLIEADTQT